MTLDDLIDQVSWEAGMISAGCEATIRDAVERYTAERVAEAVAAERETNADYFSRAVAAIRARGET